MITALGKVPGPRRILDVGFIGEHAEPFIHNAILKDLRPGEQVMGMDIQDKISGYRDSDRAAYRKVSIFDIEGMEEFRSAFDAVTLCEVFEHLPHPYLSLHKIHYALKPGGLLVATYPNPLNLRSFVSYLRQGDVTEPGFVSRFMGAPDHRVFPFPVCLAKYLTDIGFKVEEIAFLKGIATRLPFLRKFGNYVGLSARKAG